MKKSCDVSDGKLGLAACIGIVVGGCIGSAIFSLSGLTMYYAGAASVVSWILSGLVLCMYGMQVCELAVRYPKSGGIFVFPQKAFGEKNQRRGDFWGFVSSWGYIVSNFIAIAFSAIYVATYLGVSFESLSSLQVPLAVISVAVCMVLNLMKITSAGRFNNILVVALAVSMLLYACVACFGGTFDISRFASMFSQGLYGKSGFIRAIPVASVAYGTCVSLSFMVSDVRNPNRTIPRALLIGLAVVIALYVFMIVATIGNLDVALLMDEENSFFRYVPMFAAIWTSGLGKFQFLSPVVSISALVALVTTMLILIALNARAIQAVSESGYLPKALSKTSSNGVPAKATVLTAAVSAVLGCFPAWTEILVGLGALFSVVSIVITCLSLVSARKNHPLEGNDLYKAPGKSVLPVLTIAVLTLCYVPDIIGGSWKLILFTIATYSVGIAVFAVASKRKGENA